MQGTRVTCDLDAACRHRPQCQHNSTLGALGSLPQGRARAGSVMACGQAQSHTGICHQSQTSRESWAKDCKRFACSILHLSDKLYSYQFYEHWRLLFFKIFGTIKISLI